MSGPAWPPHRRVLGAVLAGYTLAVVVVLAWPTPVDAGIHGSLFHELAWLHERGMPAWIAYGQIEFTANIALFVPVGLLLTLDLGWRRWWVATIGGLSLSALAELSQHLLLPHRFGTVLDVVANTAGTLVGAGLAVLIARRRHSPVPALTAAAERRVRTPN